MLCVLMFSVKLNEGFERGWCNGMAIMVNGGTTPKIKEALCMKYNLNPIFQYCYQS